MQCAVHHLTHLPPSVLPPYRICSCLNSKTIGQNKNVNLPGVHVDLPVLTSKDINDLVNFAVRHKFDFVAASFVQSGDDVR